MFEFHPVTSVGIHAPDSSLPGLFGHAVAPFFETLGQQEAPFFETLEQEWEREEKSWMTVRSCDRRRRSSSGKHLVTPNERM
jgi:hypothetical protein